MAQNTPPRPNRAGLGGSTAVRGGVLVVGALFIGILLIWKGGGGTVETPAGDRLTAATTTTTQAGSATVPSSAPSVTTPPATLKIIAANGTKLKGLAGKAKTSLAAAGYTNVTATDTSAPVPSSIIYFAPGADADAKAVAKAGGFSTDRVAPLPAAAQVPVTPIGDARVVVLLGPDAPQAATGATTTAPRQVTTTTAAK